MKIPIDHFRILLTDYEKFSNYLPRQIKNIKIIEQKNNGYGNALIEGINSARTKYCCIINADGAMNPKYLDKMRKM